MEGFKKELKQLINRYSLDSFCSTPDFMLAHFLCEQLKTYEELNRNREHWYGREKKTTIELKEFK